MIKKNFFIPILAIAMIASMTMTSQDAFAHNDPSNPDCTANSAGTGITLLRAGSAFAGPVVHGETITAQVNLDVSGANPCAFDGGDETDAIAIQLPDESSATTVNTTFGCIGGTNNTDDNIGAADCASSPIFFDSATRNYVVDCNDVQEDGPFIGFLLWQGETLGKYHDNAGDTGAGLLTKTDTASRACIVEYTWKTEASNRTSTTQTSVSNPSDDVIITGVAGIEGTWQITSVLKNSGGTTVATGTCADLTASSFDATRTCTTSGVTIDTPDKYCWTTSVAVEQVVTTVQPVTVQ